MFDDAPRTIRIFDDKSALAQAAAQKFVELFQQKQNAAAPFTVALAGGSTPAALYGLLAAAPYKEQLDWENIHLFFGDERCVSPEDDKSNFHMVQDTLLSKMPDVVRNVHRMPADMPDADLAARQYEDELRRFFKLQTGQFPRFDLILLGMGPDGHTASLFPHKPVLHEQQRLVVASEPGLEPFVTRLTLTYPVLNNAANVLFLVENADKAETVVRVLEGPADFDGLPSQNVYPANGDLAWFLDRAAAGKLQNQE